MLLVIENSGAHEVSVFRVFAEEEAMVLCIRIGRSRSPNGDVEDIGVTIIRKFKLPDTRYGRGHKTLCDDKLRHRPFLF